MKVFNLLHAPAALPLEKPSPRFPLYRRLGELYSWSGRNGKNKNLLPVPGIKPLLPGRPARSRVAIPTELSRVGVKNSLYVFLRVNYLKLHRTGQPKG
jgi:hypothetical protein